jgi:hypothetical protein
LADEKKEPFILKTPKLIFQEFFEGVRIFCEITCDFDFYNVVFVLISIDLGIDVILHILN